MRRYPLSRLLNLLLIAVTLVGCSGYPLAPPPNLYLIGDHAYDGLPQVLQTSDVEILYVTDRWPLGDTDDPKYGYYRSGSVAWGMAGVRFGDDQDWPALIAASTREASAEQARPQLRLTEITELGRFPPTPWPFTVVDGEVMEDAAVQAAYHRQLRQVETRLYPMLQQSPRKDVLVFVHGFNNSFTDSALTLAQLWHKLGRTDVPILYSWPAGRGGLGGYAYDRESGEFTTFHLKSFLRALINDAEVERLQLVAHSRGTDVLMTAIKDLTIEARAAGVDDLRKHFRIANVVLAAPDLDIEVVNQRLSTERIGLAVDRITVYTSPKDQALGLSSWLFSTKRTGRLNPGDLDEYDRLLLDRYDNLDFIEYEGSTDLITHGYFRDSPGVSSDMIKLIRDGAPPGAEHGRPLKHIEGPFWSLDDNYMLGDPPP